MKLNVMLLSLLLVGNMGLVAQNDFFQSEKLKKIWESKDLNVPESVLPVPDKGILYISNIGSKNPTEKNNSGFISILGTDGQIKNLQWSKGLNSPKGMAIFGEDLYVTEVDQITKISLKTGEKVKSYPVEGAKFLNDIAVNENGVLFITDSQTGAVLKLENDTVSVLLLPGTFPSPNGIIWAKDKIIVGTGDKVVSVNPSTLEIEDCLLNTGGVDGLVMLEPGIFVFSNWPGTIYIMKKGEEKELLLDTSSSETSKTADFGYISDTKRLYVPTFFNSSIVCYELNY